MRAFLFCLRITQKFYGPTAGGTANYVLTGNGTSSTPTWSEKAAKAVLADKASAYNGGSVGSSTTPIYLNSNGVPTACGPLYEVTMYVDYSASTSATYLRAKCYATQILTSNTSFTPSTRLIYIGGVDSDPSDEGAFSPAGWCCVTYSDYDRAWYIYGSYIVNGKTYTLGSRVTWQLLSSRKIN